MKIIKLGVLPEDRVYHARCYTCETVFEFEGGELYSYDGSQYIDCPTCERKHPFRYNLPTQIDSVTRIK